VTEVCGGIVVAKVLTYGWGWPAGAYGSIPVGLVYLAAVNDVISDCVIILLVRFTAFFNRTLARYRSGSGSDEASVVAELLEIRHRLSSEPVQVYVMVVDAAGSTQMKRNADSLVVEYSFGRYQSWIARIVTESGGKVDLTTGDGAICAFSTAEQALTAARGIQGGVSDLNRDENRLEMPFRLRVALHAGAVVADLDKVQFTEVIDVAAHVEKLSPVGGIAITKPFLAALIQAPDLEAKGSVDGVDVFVVHEA
jgi:class 3 adenylate cyclase